MHTPYAKQPYATLDYVTLCYVTRITYMSLIVLRCNAFHFVTWWRYVRQGCLKCYDTDMCVDQSPISPSRGCVLFVLSHFQIENVIINEYSLKIVVQYFMYEWASATLKCCSKYFLYCNIITMVQYFITFLDNFSLSLKISIHPTICQHRR